jgi:signal transduction histidine kinase
MKELTIKRLAWLTFGATAVVFIATVVLALINQATDSGVVAQRDSATLGSIFLFLAWLSFGVVGLLISSRLPRNTIGWIFLAISLSWELWWFGANYLQYGVVTRPGAVPAPALVGALTSWLWAPAIGLMGTFLILLFPDGKLPTERWKPLARLSAVALIVVSLVDLLQPGSFANIGFPGIRNPLGIEAMAGVLKVLDVSIALIPICMIGCAISLIQRFRRSHGMARVQLKWLAAAAAAVAISYLVFLVISIPFASDATPPLWAQLVSDVANLSYALIPIAAGVAILKHRLFDIDIVINRALVFGALAAFITAVYVGIVVGVGTIVGSGDKPNLALSIAATALVAVAFQPVRERVQGFANRLVYGQRLTPYEVLTRFSRSLGALVSVDDVLPQIARHTAEGLGFELVSVSAYLETGKQIVTYPEVALAGAKPGETITVSYRNEPVGEITVRKMGGEGLNGQQRRLLEQLAAQAGVVLHNYGLAMELRARLEELSAQDADLRDSRERLVSAADTSRRVIEREIRERVERRLLGIASDLDAAETTLTHDSEATEMLLEGLAARTNETLEALRDLARGIYPPLLVDKGLIVALEAHIRKIGLEVTLNVDQDLAEARFDRSVETSCYFCLRETLDNIARHAGGAHAWVDVGRQSNRLMFSVRDEGPGFDTRQPGVRRGLQSMRDRVEAAGGVLTIESTRGRGTTVTGWVPLETSEEADDLPLHELEAAAQASSSWSGPNSDLEIYAAAPASSARGANSSAS